jgi:hypothetical protein
LEKEVATHSSVLAWRIPGTGDPGRCHLWGHTESDTTEAMQQQEQQQQQWFLPYIDMDQKFLFLSQSTTKIKVVETVTVPFIILKICKLLKKFNYQNYTKGQS